MSFILGTNVILYIVTNASPEELNVIGCAKNVRLTFATDTAERTTKGSGTAKEYKPLITSWGGSIDGLSSEDNITIRELLAYAKDITELSMLFELADGGLPVAGQILLTSVEAGGPSNDAATYNVTLQGTGDLSLYGLYPLDFRITLVQVDTPSPGDTTLTFDFNEPEPPGVTYDIKVNNLDTGASSTDTGGAATRTIVVTSGVNYGFQVRATQPGGVSNYSPQIYYP